MPGPFLNSLAREKLAMKEGERRTVFFTRKVDEVKGGGAYARTGQYLGEWKNNKWDGKGTLEQANGNRYVGEWQEGKRSGMGTLWVKEKGTLRKRYAGQWEDDRPHGRGMHFYKDGSSYNGEWKFGSRHGVGIMSYACGDVYEGDWFDGKRHGFGVLDYANGDHFEGLWVDDAKEGEGVHFYFDAEKKAHTKRYDGEWVDDRPKAGFYSEMPADPLAPASRIPAPLPRSKLADADGVMRERLSEIRAERVRVRAERVPLDEHFTAEELEALHVAFDRVDVDSAGVVPIAELPRAFSQASAPPRHARPSRVPGALRRRN